MPLSDFKVVESVGKGSFASVYKVMRKSDKQLYALKRVKIGKMSKREIQDALNEIRFLASIRHRNVVGFLEAFLGSTGLACLSVCLTIVTHLTFAFLL
jgi:NIMA (never in mitosis gene a)-related kinase